MAIFGWGKKDDDAKGDGNPSPGEGGKDAHKDASKDASKDAAKDVIEFSPEKAKKFFDRAATVHEATNFGYAMDLWIRGLRQDPGTMLGLEGFFKSSASFFNENPKGEKDDTFKSTLKAVGGRSDLDKYLTSLLNWSAHPFDPACAVKAMEGAANLGLSAPAVWIADRAFGAVSKDKKPKKDHLISVRNVFARFDKMDKAVEAGEAAARLDPSDARLQAEMRNLAANNTIHKGGFDATGEAGGFRSNIRDAQKQRQMEEQDRVVTTEEVLDRQVAAARADYETSPGDRPIAIKFIDALLKRGGPEDEEQALGVATLWHEKTQEFRFREYADNIRLRQLRRKVSRMKALAEQPGGSGDEAKEAYRAARVEYLKMQISALKAQVEAYPTDLSRKFELGRMLYEVGKFEDAIGLLQEAKGDIKNRAKVQNYLGLSFQKIGWNDEAIETLRQAIVESSPTDEAMQMELKYGLMEALLARATEQSSQTDTDESYKLASQIAILNINYKSIRTKRDEIKALIAKLKGG